MNCVQNHLINQSILSSKNADDSEFRIQSRCNSTSVFLPSSSSSSWSSIINQSINQIKNWIKKVSIESRGLKPQQPKQKHQVFDMLGRKSRRERGEKGTIAQLRTCVEFHVRVCVYNPLAWRRSGEHFQTQPRRRSQPICCGLNKANQSIVVNPPSPDGFDFFAQNESIPMFAF